MTTDVNRLTSGATGAPAGALPMLPSVCVRAVLDALVRLGDDGHRLAAAAGLGRAALEDPDALIPCTAWDALITASMRERPRANLALRLAENTPIGAYPLIDYLMLSSATVGEGLRRLSRYYRLVGALTPLELHEDENPIRVVMSCSIPFLAEYSVALPLIHLGRESNGSVRAEWASFLHIPEDVADLSSAIGCEVRVGQTWNGFALSRASWQYTMPRRDPVLLRLLERQADAALSNLPPNPTLTEQVRRALTNGVAEGDTSIEAIARSLAIAPRTLQRRLSLERTTFQRVHDSVRRELAETHLRRSILSITEIAFVLGYSEPAAFHRAFRRWHGVTPQTFRAGQPGR